MTLPQNKKRIVPKTLLTMTAIASILSGSFTAMAPASAAPGDVVNPIDAKSYRYSSEFGPRCIPVVNGSTDHLGQDMAASDGTVIRAIADGVVTHVKESVNGASAYIIVRHTIDGQLTHSAYMHMWHAGKYVKAGDTVKKGQQIALVGSSGASTSPHLHFEIWKGAWYTTGTAVNPTTWMKTQGVDLKADASIVYNYTVPSSCAYYFNSNTVVRDTPSLTGKVTKNVTVNTPMSSVPGSASQSGTFVKVTTGGTTGWAERKTVSPTKVKVPTIPTVPAPSPILRPVPAPNPIVKPAPKPAPAPKPVVTPAVKNNASTTADLHLRASASGTAKSVGIMKKGTAVHLTGKKSGTWVEVKWGTKTGWASSAYIKSTTVAPVKTATPAKTATTTTSLNLRAQASATSTILGSMSKGTKVQLTGKSSGNWVQIKWNNKTGWASKTYLK